MFQVWSRGNPEQEETVRDHNGVEDIAAQFVDMFIWILFASL